MVAPSDWSVLGVKLRELVVGEQLDEDADADGAEGARFLPPPKFDERG